MNAKTAKLLRKYCKKYNKSYKIAKLQFSKMSPKQQFQMIVNLKLMLKETPITLENQPPGHILFKGAASSPPLSPTDKKSKSTPVKGVINDGVGE